MVLLIFSEIESKIKVAKKNLKSIGYIVKEVSAESFYDFMTGEIFSKDTTSLADVLGNEYLMIHEVEINNKRYFKKTRRNIDLNKIYNIMH